MFAKVDAKVGDHMLARKIEPYIETFLISRNERILIADRALAQ